MGTGRSHRVGRVLQHDGDGPRADGQAGPRAAPRAGARGVGARVRALAGLPRLLPVRGHRARQAPPGWYAVSSNFEEL